MLAAAPLLLMSAAAPAPAGGLTIDCGGGRIISLTSAELTALPHVPVTRVDHGTHVDCSGVAVTEIIGLAGLPSGEKLRGAALATVIVASGADGYRVAFSLGELDPGLGHAGAVIADHCARQALGAEVGPLRLIVPGDERPARSVRQLVRLAVVTVR